MRETGERGVTGERRAGTPSLRGAWERGLDSRVRTAADRSRSRSFPGPDIEWVPVTHSLLAVDSYRGFEGVRRFWGDFLSTWDSYEVEPLRLCDAGDQVAVVVHIVGRTQELAVDETRSSLLTVRNGRVVRVLSFADPEGVAQGRRVATIGGLSWLPAFSPDTVYVLEVAPPHADVTRAWSSSATHDDARPSSLLTPWSLVVTASPRSGFPSGGRYEHADGTVAA
jgi:ketosteroid isomerase-like protein